MGLPDGGPFLYVKKVMVVKGKKGLGIHDFDKIIKR